MNKIRGSGTGFPSMAKDSDSARESQSGDDEDDEDNSDTENGSFKRTVSWMSWSLLIRVENGVTMYYALDIYRLGTSECYLQL